MQDSGMEGLLRQYINNHVNRMFTAIPCRVVGGINLATQRVDVRPVVDVVKPDGSLRPHAAILGVPLMFPGSSTAQFSFPVSEGDTVLCVFSQRSIERFKLGAGDSHRPLNLGKYSKQDAMAIPGLYTFDAAVNNPSKRSLEHSVDDTVMSTNIGSGSECEVRLGSSGDITINSPKTVTVNCKDSVVNSETAAINASSSMTIDSPTTTVTGDMLVQGVFTYTSGLVGSGAAGGSTASISGSMDITGDVTSSSDVKASGVSLANHVHGGIKSGSGTTEGPK